MTRRKELAKLDILSSQRWRVIQGPTHARSTFSRTKSTFSLVNSRILTVGSESSEDCIGMRCVQATTENGWEPTRANIDPISFDLRHSICPRIVLFCQDHVTCAFLTCQVWIKCRIHNLLSLSVWNSVCSSFYHALRLLTKLLVQTRISFLCRAEMSALSYYVSWLSTYFQPGKALTSQLCDCPSRMS